MIAQRDSSVPPVARVQFPTMTEYLEGFFPDCSQATKANLNLFVVWTAALPAN